MDFDTCAAVKLILHRDRVTHYKDFILSPEVVQPKLASMERMTVIYEFIKVAGFFLECQALLKNKDVV